MPRWLRLTAVVLVLGLLGIAGVLYYRGTPPSEIATLLTSDAVVQLRATMRPARANGPRVLVIALDGVGAKEFRDALRTGGMPRVAALLGAELDRDGGRFEHGLAPDSVWSILPSTTFAAWTSVYTGVGVAEHGVAGNEWFDRMSMTLVAPAPVSVKEHEDAVRVYSDSLLHRWIAVPTVFERANVRSYVTLAAQYRGADLLVRPDAGMFADLAASFAGGVVEGESNHETYSALDESAVDHTLEAIAEHGLADLQVVYFPGVDLFTHVADSAITEQERYLSNVLDRAIGRLLDSYAARGALEETYVLFISDHGHTPALADDRHALGTGGEGEPGDVLKSAGFRVRPFELTTDDSTYQAVLAYQGALAYVYLADRSTCPTKDSRCDWKASPRLEADVLPAVRAFHAAGRTGATASKLKGAIDLILARDSRAAATEAPFRIWNGKSLVPLRAYLAANPRPDLIDLEARLQALAVGPLGHRSGDIILLSRYRDVDVLNDRYYFSSRYRSWHGSPSRQDSEILFALAHPSRTGEELRALVEGSFGTTPTQLDITPLILKLLQHSPSADTSSGQFDSNSAPAALPNDSVPRVAAPAADSGAVLALDGEGLRIFLRLSGSARLLAFGDPRSQVLAALSRLRNGKLPQITENIECGATVATWPASGLQLWFTADSAARFIGWSLGGRAPADSTLAPLTTASGIGLGSSRAALESVYVAKVARSTLGVEFSAGGLAGLLASAGAKATISNLWAGQVCLAR